MVLSRFPEVSAFSEKVLIHFLYFSIVLHEFTRFTRVVFFHCFKVKSLAKLLTLVKQCRKTHQEVTNEIVKFVIFGAELLLVSILGAVVLPVEV